MYEQQVYRIVLCDSKSKHARAFAEKITLLSTTLGIRIRLYSYVNRDSELEYIMQTSELIDIAIIDAAFDGDGVQLARALQKRKPLIPIIMFAGEEEKCVDVDRKLVIGVLRKPILGVELKTLFFRALGQVDWYARQSQNYFLRFIKNKEQIEIPIKGIISIEKVLKMVVFKTTSGIYEFRKTLKELEQELPPYFLRINQSVIVNVEEIEVIKGRRVYMSTKEYFMIGRTYNDIVSLYLCGILNYRDVTSRRKKA